MKIARLFVFSLAVTFFAPSFSAYSVEATRPTSTQPSGVSASIGSNELEKFLGHPVKRDFTSRIQAQSATSSVGDPGDGTSGETPIVNIDELRRLDVDHGIKPHGLNLLGDRIDMNTGALEFYQTDISLPGNSELEVAIHRYAEQGHKYTYSFQGDFGDWELDTPRIWVKVAAGKPPNGPQIGGVLRQPSTTPSWEIRCVDAVFDTQRPIGPGPVFWGDTISQANVVEDFSYSDGMYIRTPAAGNEEMLHVKGRPSWPNDAVYGTKSGWKIKCLSEIGAQNGGGQGFIATAPNGDEYRFDRLVFRDAPAIPNSKIDRYYAFLFATEVKDVHGNWVKYEYNSDNDLRRIHSNDGRSIELFYGPVAQNYEVCAELQVFNPRTLRLEYRTHCHTYDLSRRRIDRIVADPTPLNAAMFR